MPRAHNRKDFEYVILKGRPHFNRAGYACIITQSTAYPDERSIYHVETFYGDNGVKVRAEARRFGSDICKGKRRLGTLRNMYVPVQFEGRDKLPKPENEIEVR